MTDDRPISPQQALTAALAAGLDPEKPLSEQVYPSGAPGVDGATVKQWVTDAVAEALDAVEQEPAGTVGSSREEQGRALLRGIESARTPWHDLTKEEPPDAA